MDDNSSKFSEEVFSLFIFKVNDTNNINSLFSCEKKTKINKQL